MNQNQESVLLRTSAASDVVCSNGVLTVAGLSGTRKSRISSITQIKYKAEVVQVITIGATAYTPTSGTRYGVLIGDTNRIRNGAAEQLKPYFYVTPSNITDLGATAALQREAISLALVAAINADSKNFVVAASLGSGNGFTVTDDAGYYPAFSQTGTGRLGASEVLPVENNDGSGFLATNVSTTTAAVIASGVGATLAAGVPVVDAYYGGLLSGYLQGLLNGLSFTTKSTTSANNNLPAVSGQNYDIFVITSLVDASAHNQRGQLALVPKMQAVAVDNGTGSDTGNLAGFLAFERIMRKHISQLYSSDVNSWIEFYDSPILFQGAAGAVPTTTGENKVATDYGQFVYNQVGTQTITVPTPGNTGLVLDQDLTATEGAEYTPALTTVNNQSFIVGKQEFSFVYKTITADHTDANLYVGFRKKAAHAADFNNYTDLGAIGFLGDLVYTWGILNNAATVATNTTVVPTDAAYEEYVVNVDINGVVTAKRNGVTYPVYSAGTTALVFDAGDEMIPFFLNTNIGGGDPDTVVNHSIATSTINWLV
jgi:hypothetical protein